MQWLDPGPVTSSYFAPGIASATAFACHGGVSRSCSPTRMSVGAVMPQPQDGSRRPAWQAARRGAADALRAERALRRRRTGQRADAAAHRSRPPGAVHGALLVLRDVDRLPAAALGPLDEMDATYQVASRSIPVAGWQLMYS